MPILELEDEAEKERERRGGGNGFELPSLTFRKLAKPNARKVIWGLKKNLEPEKKQRTACFMDMLCYKNVT